MSLPSSESSSLESTLRLIQGSGISLIVDLEPGFRCRCTNPRFNTPSSSKFYDLGSKRRCLLSISISHHQSPGFELFMTKICRRCAWKGCHNGVAKTCQARFMKRFPSMRGTDGMYGYIEM